MSSTLDPSFPPYNDITTIPPAGTLGTPSPASIPAGDDARIRPDPLGPVARGAHNTIDRLVDTSTPRVQRLKEGLTSASQAVKTRASELRETGHVWADSVRGVAREKPLAALATALAVGVLVARLTRR